jgi:hypothetical protein
MKLRSGLNVVIGHKTWAGELPDDKFAIMSKDWTAEQVEEFKARYCESTEKKKKKDK